MTNLVSSSKHKGEVALRDMLEAVSAELVAIACGADDMQRLVGPLARQAGLKADDELVRDLQNVDRLVQRLFSIAGRMRAVSAATPVEWRIEEAFSPAVGDTASDGECELF